MTKVAPGDQMSRMVYLISYLHTAVGTLFLVDYELWPFDDRDYAIVCTVKNNIVNTDSSL